MPCHRGLLVDPRLGILNAKRDLVTRPDSRSSSGWFLPLSQSAHHRDHFDCVRRLVRIPLAIRRIRLALRKRLKFGRELHHGASLRYGSSRRLTYTTYVSLV